ncbi:MAG TPA: 6-bladed beta-propeller [Bacteroidales bacterium]|nr:6-bladed beta-propeller [Bacteroidales bacterium]
MSKHPFLILLICIGCQSNSNTSDRYTLEQKASLHMEATQKLTVEADSAILIDLNPFLKEQWFEFGSLVKEVKLVPLETTSESILGNIEKVVVTDSHIYIRDDYKRGGLVIFTSQGKFVKRIPNGKGPGELIRLYDIDYDKENNELVAYRHSWLMFFSRSGQFIREKRLPFGFYNFAVIPDGYVFKTLDSQGNEHLGALEDYTLLVTDKDFKIKNAGLPYPPDDRICALSFLHKNSSFYITHKFRDTIYQYTNTTNKLKACYILDYSKKKFPMRYVNATRDEFNNVAKQNDYYYYIGEYFDADQHHFFTLSNMHVGYNTIIFRDKQSGNMRGGTFPNYDPKEIPQIGYPVAVFNDYFISIYAPGTNDTFSPTSSLIAAEDYAKVKNITKEDNPVLVFYKLKGF